MNIKDINGPTDSLSPNLLDQMFEMRIALNDLYVSQGKLPSYPLTDLSKRDQQTFFRDLLGFLEEEIYEAYDEVINLTVLEPVKESYPQCEEHLIKLNTEIADVNHFFLEVFTYLGFDADDIKAYYNKVIAERGIQVLRSNNTLEMALNYASFIGTHTGLINSGMTRLSSSLVLNYVLDNEPSPLTAAHKGISIPLLEDHDSILFKVTWYLNRVRGLLKSKYWRETETQPNVELIYTYIMEAWLHWTVYMAMMGLDHKSLYRTYYKKHQINIERLTNGY